MNLSQLNTASLRNLIKLTKKRDTLLSEIAKVESAINATYSGKPAKVAKAAKPGRKRGRPAKAKSAKTGKVGRPAKVAAPKARRGGRRGALKGKILANLKEAGEKGVSVKDLSKKLGVKNQNVHVWFSSTGKKLGTIQKIGAGRYRLKA